MNAVAIEHTEKRRKRNYPAHRISPSRKLNRDLARTQAERGMSNTEIAKLQGVNQSTVSDFMRRHEPEREGVEEFKKNRADVLARLQAKSLKVTEGLIDSIKDGELTTLTPGQKTGLLLALNAQHGTTFDKERLERGQSTSNQSVVSRLIDSTLKDLYREPAPTAQVALPVKECAPSASAPVQGPGAGILERGPAGGQSASRDGIRLPAPRATKKKPR